MGPEGEAPFFHTHPPALSSWKEQMQMHPVPRMHCRASRGLSGSSSGLLLGADIFPGSDNSCASPSWTKMKEPVTAT